MRSTPTFDRTRAGELIRLLTAALELPQGLVAEQADLVENQVPAGVAPRGLEHAQFLFMTVPCDRGTKSAALWARAKAAWETGSPLYALGDVADGRVGPEQVLALMSTEIRPRYARPASAYWIANARRLMEEHAGDPRRLLEPQRDARAAYAAIRSYQGFGPKTGGMMLRAAIGLGWASDSGVSAVEIPVDVHDARITLRTGAMRIEGRSSEEVAPTELALLARPVRRFLTDTCAEEGVDWPDLDRALWLIGSRGCVPRRCHLCPLQQICSVPERLPLFERASA